MDGGVLGGEGCADGDDTVGGLNGEISSFDGFAGDVNLYARNVEGFFFCHDFFLSFFVIPLLHRFQGAVMLSTGFGVFMAFVKQK